MRGGIWKPRTRPGSFEGLGKDALGIFKSATESAGIKALTEVANSEHVEAALKADIDALWIGARTTANPFSVQELADALKGVNIPVFVKNPINPDMQLWIGAIERLRNAGIEDITGIHRGFASASESPYRNPPRWNFVVKFKTTFPEIPVICDPSHIGGNRALVETISQKAIDMDMDGLMIEVHPDPQNALSDAAQQITPERFHELLVALVFRSQTIENPLVAQAMESLRSKIDSLDEQLIRLLSQRMDTVAEIAGHKKEEGITIFQLQRWKEVLESRSVSGSEKGLSEEFIREMISLVHQESIRIQNIVMNEHPKPAFGTGREESTS